MTDALPDLWRLETTLPKEQVPLFEPAIEPHVDSLSWFEVPDDPAFWQLQAWSRERPAKERLAAGLAVIAKANGLPEPEVTYAREPERDWLAKNLMSFAPVRAGRYFVHGSHEADPPPPAAIPLLVDAGVAFGSGEHATTHGCLLALDALARHKRVRRPLDLGCGSGILAMAIARTWRVPVRATDIDTRSVMVAHANARLNGVGAFVRTAVSDGFYNPLLAKEGPFDLIVANILARPLMKLALPMARHLSADGTVVLSGLLTRQETQVLSAYRRQGLSLDRRHRRDGWSTLVLSR